MSSAIGSGPSRLTCCDLQVRESVLLDQVYVSCGDCATGIDIIAEVAACDRLQGLCFAQIGVATGHYSGGIDVADEHAHCRGKSSGAVAGRVSNTAKSDSEFLHVGDSGKIYHILETVLNRAAAH